MDFQLGMNAKAYYGAADTPLVNLVELTNVKDVNLSLDAGEADVTTRANSGWRATAATLKEASAEFEMVWKTSDAALAAIRDAYLNGTELAMCFLTDDKGTTGAEGPRGNWTITNFSRNEALEEGITISVTVKLSKFEEWVEV